MVRAATHYHTQAWQMVRVATHYHTQAWQMVRAATHYHTRAWQMLIQERMFYPLNVSTGEDIVSQTILCDRE